MKQLAKYIILLGLVWSCSESSNSEHASKNGKVPESDDKATLEPEQLDSSASSHEHNVFLDGIYATSSGLPFKDYHVDYIFDHNQKTYWKTLPGAGPDEGIMLYFKEPVFVSGVELNAASGTNLGTLLKFEVYADGQTYYSGKRIGKEIRNMYIRFTEIQECIVKQQEVGNGTWTQKTMPSQLAIGVSELTILGHDNKPLHIRTPRRVNGRISASTTLSPAITYSASNLMDSRLDFGWAEGAKGDGTGSSLVFEFEDGTRISGFRMWNGYQRSKSHFLNNAMPSRVTFGNEPFSFERRREPSTHTFQSAKTSPIKLEVVDVHQGNSYEDLVISELRLYEPNGRPIIIDNPNAEHEVLKNRENPNKILNQFMDKNIQLSYRESNEENDRYYYRAINHSFILRSNNTFVLFLEDIESESAADEDDGYEASSEQICDGSWELISASPNEVKIKIFGKLYIPQKQDEELYGGTSSQDDTRIFKETLTLTADGIKGEKLIDQISLLK